MIIYGSNATEISNEIITGKCSQCGAQSSVYLSIFIVYAHMYWIPIFPKRKIGIAKCLHCNYVSKEEEFTEELTSYYKTLKSNSRTPLWTFIGLLILFVFVTFFWIKNNS